MLFVLFLALSLSSAKHFSGDDFLEKNVTFPKDAIIKESNDLLLEDSDCGLGPYDGGILSYDVMFFQIDGACQPSLMDGCGENLGIFDCAEDCENDSSCNSVTYNEDENICCKSTDSYETVGQDFSDDCEGYNFWQKHCAGGQDYVQSHCPTLGCGDSGLIEDTSYSSRKSGVVTACRCPGESVKCGMSCVDIDTCDGGPCDITISGISGSNSWLNRVFTYDGLYDYQPSYNFLIMSGNTLYEVFLWRGCYFGVWFISLEKGNTSSYFAYVFSNEILAEDVGSSWRVFDSTAGQFVDDNDVMVSCVYSSDTSESTD